MGKKSKACSSLQCKSYKVYGDYATGGCYTPPKYLVQLRKRRGRGRRGRRGRRGIDDQQSGRWKVVVPIGILVLGSMIGLVNLFLYLEDQKDKKRKAAKEENYSLDQENQMSLSMHSLSKKGFKQK